ncbi:hypothetical protein DBR06_SOUSAS4210124, partial [Sousa chinensis]
VAEAEKAPLQRPLQVTVAHFLDWSGGVFQPTSRLLPGGGRWLWGLASVNVGLLGHSATVAQDWCPCSVPEPLHLMLPMALLANTPVNQGSIGPPVVSISGCFSLFNKAIVLDGYNRWVP